MDHPDQLRKEFEGRVRALDATTVEGDPDARRINQLSAELRDRVAEWDELGLTQEILTPLLRSEAAGIRASAAGFLLRRGEQERSLVVLREIAEDISLGDVSSMAETALMAWDAEQR
ncbi:hypothetical protein [Actinokineospora xionganensis]|uniref:ANTAR domain-containing protein n=1 Tax=Actinokineospora xionganensis TaxID=2684470 RepID=A0ABR7L814_9PSEU|nr:hypothetical protein [Actinokineospora xionganensis]MBC6448820.1 hypothetical protein [Actinokineospora xionganensis]